MASKKHVHKYHKVKMNSTDIWACALPDCNHHMPPHYIDTLPGKASLCWKCGERFILDSDNMKLDRPICFNCAHPEMVSEETDLFGKSDIMADFLKRREQVKSE